MYRHLIIAIILVIGVVVLVFNYLTNSYLQKNPSSDKSTVKAVLDLPIYQIGVWAFSFFVLWSFLPTHPNKDGGDAFLTSDFANWAVDNHLHQSHIDLLYNWQTVLGVGFLIFGGIAAYILYSLLNGKVNNVSSVKKLSLIDSIFSGILAWNILSGIGTFIFLEIFGKPLLNIGEGLLIAFVIIVNLAILIWLIMRIVRFQKAFNNLVPAFINGNPVNIFSSQASSPSSTSTKKCPYCGEEILAVAKKCKHCGEWIKEVDVVVEVKKKTCLVCGEEINADATVCPICHEKIEQPRNAFREKVMAEKKEKASESKILHSGCFWIIAVVAIVAIIVICVSVYSPKDSSTSGNQSYDSIEAVDEEEVMPIEEEPMEEEIVDIPGMVQHTEDQGKYIPGDDDPWNN